MKQNGYKKIIGKRKALQEEQNLDKFYENQRWENDELCILAKNDGLRNMKPWSGLYIITGAGKAGQDKTMQGWWIVWQVKKYRDKKF